MVVGNPELALAIPFYGSATPLEDVPNLQTPVLGIYAREDARINGKMPSLEAEFMVQQKDYKFATYPGAAHPFFNDTDSRYHPESAEAAWMGSPDWFEDHLMGT